MINFNGDILQNDNIISVDNRAFKYGDGVFDTLKCVSGKIHFWEDHYLRLMASMRIMRMEIPISFTMDFLQSEIFKLLDACQLQSKAARIRISVFRKAGGLYTPKTNQVDYLIEAQVLEAPFYTFDNRAYQVDIFKDHCIFADLLSTVKTISRPVQIVGSVYAQENDYDNCLLINQNKNVVSTLNGNLFSVSGSVIKTPALSEGCLNGIIRKNLIKIIQKTPDWQIEETVISPFDLQKADELFMTNSIVGIQPITQFRKKIYTSAVAQSLIGKLNLSARLD